MLFRDYDAMVNAISTYIDGPKSPYDYSYRITNDRLAANFTFEELYIEVYDVAATLVGYGSEKFELEFTDLTVIQDEANNTLSEGSIVGYLSPYEYIPPEVEGSANSGGQGMKYTLISLFGANMAIKMVISSSAALMWSLIHVLQAFRYILMINILMPKMIKILMEYLAVVIGEVDEIEAILPDYMNTYVIDSDNLNQDAITLERFEENGYDSPYLTDNYGKQMSLALLFFIFVVPSIFIGMKLFKNVKFLGAKFIGAWGELFWNGPLRTFLELFIEICLGFFLHSLNVSILCS